MLCLDRLRDLILLLQHASPHFPYTTLFRSVSLDAPAAFRSMEPCVRDVMSRWAFPPSSAEYGTEFPYSSDDGRSEEHTSELQSRLHRACRLPPDTTNTPRLVRAEQPEPATR